MTATMDMDQLDLVAASAFEGYLVRKDLVRKYARQYPVPTYVVEFMLGRYCASTDREEISAGLEVVESREPKTSLAAQVGMGEVQERAGVALTRDLRDLHLGMVDKETNELAARVARGSDDRDSGHPGDSAVAPEALSSAMRTT